MPILVIGATGLLGGPVARGLLERKFDVRVMSRGAKRVLLQLIARLRGSAEMRKGVDMVVFDDGLTLAILRAVLAAAVGGLGRLGPQVAARIKSIEC